MKRGSPKPWLAHSVHRGYRIPCFHCSATSSQEVAWNSKSCPEAMPRQKKGATISSETQKERRNAGHQPPEKGAAAGLLTASTDELIQCKRIVTAKESGREDGIDAG